MKNFTTKDYKLIIKTKFKIIEDEGSLLDLVDPSPAKLRNLSIDIFAKGLTTSDENVFTSFFNVREHFKLETAIRNCNVDRFKPIISFLKGGNTEDRERIEMAAILVDLQSRPFKRFSKEEIEEEVFENKRESTGLVIEEDNIGKEKKNEETRESLQNGQEQSGGFDSFVSFFCKKKNIILSISVFTVCGVFALWNFNDEGDCMVWNKDHYEAVSCDMVSTTLSFLSPVVTKKEEGAISNFKKIKVCDTTSFFKMGKPCVWYGKSFDGSYDCFSAPGLHPETGKTLRPITQYIIDKHLKK